MAFNRIVELSIGEGGTVGTLIKDFYIEFEVVKSIKATTNKASIVIKNLSDATYNKIGKVGHHLILKAGYADESVSSIFFGDITRATKKRDSIDTVISIEAFDGQKDLIEKNVSLGYSEQTPVTAVVSDVLTVLGFPFRGLNKLSAGLKYANGYSFIGKAKDALTEALRKDGLSWTVQNEEILILKDNETVDPTAIRLTPDTGLIGVPEPVGDESGKSELVEKKRWKVESLLIQRLIPGAMVNIDSDSAKGYFTVEDVTFSGNNFDGDFKASMEVVEV